MNAKMKKVDRYVRRLYRGPRNLNRHTTSMVTLHGKVAVTTSRAQDAYKRIEMRHASEADEWASYHGARAHTDAVRVLRIGPTNWRDDYGDTRTMDLTIRAPSLDAAIWFAGTYYGETYCQHPYDCCGHFYNGMPWVRHLKRNEYLISTVANRNV